MDLEAANIANARAGRLTRVGMLTCFALASGVLIAALALTDGQVAPSALAQHSRTPL